MTSVVSRIEHSTIGVLERTTELSLAVHLAIFVPMTLLMSLALMRPLKGAVIGLQWAVRMHGFGGAPDEAEH